MWPSPISNASSSWLAPSPGIWLHNPKHLPYLVRAGLDGLIDALTAAQHVMEMFRRSLTNGNARKRLLRLSIRLIKILAEIRELHTT
jgi:hypothetical protein